MQLNPNNRLISNYIQLRKLGQSSSGDVFLVEESKNGAQWALKMIPKKMLAENQGFKQMLDSQIECLRKLNEPHIVKLKQFLEDNDYFYMVLEYCDVGDILNLQAKQPNRAFKLQTATQYLSQVLLSLDALHSRGYMHGQINLQNILVKNQNNRQVLKVRFDGFTKLTLKLKAQTSVYIQYFKAPQIFLCNLKSQSSADFLGCEIDVWAFGVLFFFMLNMEFPFKLNPHLDWSRWYQQLRKESENFSYRKAVRNTKKKITQNCTNEMQDLFKRLFQINPKKRITATQLRKHPIFAPYFLPLHLIERVVFHPIKKRSVPTFESDKKSSPQKSLLFLQLQQINFLINITQEMELIEQQIGSLPFLILSYHIFKYCLILLKRLHSQLSSQKQNLKIKQQAFVDSEAQIIKMHFLVRQRYKQTQVKCQQNYIEIYKLNDLFPQVFSLKAIENDPGRIFFRSFRKSTSLIYSLIKNKLKLGSTHRLCYILCSICIVHNFNKLQNNNQTKQKMFCTLFNLATTKISKEYMSFNKVIDHLRGCDSQQLLKLAKKIIDYIA